MTNLEKIRKKYYTLGIDSLEEINGLPVLYDKNWDYVAVNLSGGADSALFTALLANHIQQNGYKTKIKIISFVRVYKTRPWAPFISLDVYNKLKQMFPTVIDERIEAFIPPQFEEGAGGPDLIGNRSGDRVYVSEFNMYAIKRYSLSRIYNCTTMNPEVPLTKAPADRNDSLKFATRNKLLLEVEWLPFKHVEKDWIIEQYFVNGWKDLLHTTRSCEGEFKGITYDTYVHGTKLDTCGKCFWCLEREWAIDKVKEKGLYSEL